MSLPINPLTIASVQTDAANHLLSSAAKKVSAHEAEVRNVANQFESMFVSLMLKSMRSSMTEDGLFGGEGSDTYGSLFDMYMGQHLASNDALGIGRLIEQYMQESRP